MRACSSCRSTRFLAGRSGATARSALARAALRAPLLMGLLALALALDVLVDRCGATLRRSVWLALTMAFGLYLAWRYDWRRLHRSAGRRVHRADRRFVRDCALLAPSIGVMTAEHPGAWSGLWTHKNTLGGIMALGVAICAAAAIV